MLNIRDIREDDREIFYRFGKLFYGGPACNHEIPEENFALTFDRCLASQNDARLVMLEEGDQIIGYFLLAFTWSNEAGGVAVWAEELYFEEEFRGKGYGSEVLAWMEKEYAHAKRFRLEVAFSNKRPIALYEKLGYEELLYYQMVKDYKSPLKSGE